MGCTGRGEAGEPPACPQLWSRKPVQGSGRTAPPGEVPRQAGPSSCSSPPPTLGQEAASSGPRWPADLRGPQRLGRQRLGAGTAGGGAVADGSMARLILTAARSLQFLRGLAGPSAEHPADRCGRGSRGDTSREASALGPPRGLKALPGQGGLVSPSIPGTAEALQGPDAHPSSGGPDSPPQDSTSLTPAWPQLTQTRAQHQSGLSLLGCGSEHS